MFYQVVQARRALKTISLFSNYTTEISPIYIGEDITELKDDLQFWFVVFDS